jgi:hypothetical protein
MHIVIAVDTTQGTAANRVRIYVNGSEVTVFSIATYPSQNADTFINSATTHTINKESDFYANYGNMYVADAHFIDGQALDPTSFGEFDATTGVWVPKAYTGSYGTNGFRLDFSDNSAATATTLGKDRAGSNNWTPNNLSVTAGAGNDSLVDVPTNGAQTDTGAGAEVRGNYATWNPLSKASVATLSNGNLDASYTGASYPHLGSDSTIFLPASGKWYWEITATTVGELWTGIRNVVDGKQSTYYRDGSGGFNNIRIEASSSTGSANAASYTNGDVIGVAVNCDGSTIAWYKNGSQVGSTYSLTNVANLVPFAGHASTVGSAAVVANFGQRPFAYTAPSGFKALNTANLPAPVVTKPSTVFDVALDTGANILTAAQNKLSTGTDLLWIKDRANTNNHQLIDTVRGGTATLQSNTTAAETTYSAPSGSSVAWCWDAGSSTVTNTVGSISSQVRANASAGFSIVTYTGAGSGATIGHGLGVAPRLIIVKNRTNSIDWLVYTTMVDGSLDFLFLNTTAAKGESGENLPTSTVFSIASNTFVGANTRNYVAYCFAPVAGYSSFGSYVGNGSASDGPFVYTGFRPRWLLVKRSDAAGEGWYLWDTARQTYNVTDLTLSPNTSAAEGGGSARYFDLLSNGFKVRSSDGAFNASGGTYIYAAFAEHPFQYARAR